MTRLEKILDVSTLENYLNTRDLTEYRMDNSLEFNKYSLNNNGYTNWQQQFKLPNDSNMNIYLGYPWCNQLCAYCHYTSGVNKNEERQKKFLNLILKEISLYKDLFRNTKISSVYFGGGTPTLMDAEDLNIYLSEVLNHFTLATNATVTVESDVTNLLPEKLEVCAKYANRLSIGVQSFNTELRKQLNRKNAQEKILSNLRLATEYFPRLNIDLIYGLTEQTHADFFKDILICIEEGIPSITLYRLEIHQNTKIQNIYNLDKSKFPTHSQSLNMFEIAQDILEKNGYVQNPIGWFVKKKDSSTSLASWEDRIDNWKAASYIGFGVKAYSHTTDWYHKNYDKFEDWECKLETGELPIEKFRKKTDIEVLLSNIMKFFRTSGLISKKRIISLLPNNHNSQIIDNLLQKYVEIGLMEIETSDEYRLTKRGNAAVHLILKDITDIFIVYCE